MRGQRLREEGTLDQDLLFKGKRNRQIFTRRMINTISNRNFTVITNIMYLKKYFLEKNMAENVLLYLPFQEAKNDKKSVLKQKKFVIKK